MKVLLAHNYYGSAAPSGENRVFDSERRLLEKHGHEVRIFVRDSDEVRGQGLLGIVRASAAAPWNPWTVRSVRRLLGEFEPEIVHIHNTFPLISPAIFSAIGNRAARV